MTIRTAATAAAGAFLSIGLLASDGQGATTVSGVVRSTSGAPVAGIRVRALDEDTFNADDSMGEAVSNEEGRYTITYEARNWDASTFFSRAARHPDVYAVAELRCEGRFARLARSRTHDNVRPSTDLTIDFTVDVPMDPECTICGTPACCRREATFLFFARRCRGSCRDGVRCITRTSNWLGATSCGCAIEVP